MLRLDDIEAAVLVTAAILRSWEGLLMIDIPDQYIYIYALLFSCLLVLFIHVHIYTYIYIYVPYYKNAYASGIQSLYEVMPGFYHLQEGGSSGWKQGTKTTSWAWALPQFGSEDLSYT